MRKQPWKLWGEDALAGFCGSQADGLSGREHDVWRKGVLDSWWRQEFQIYLIWTTDSPYLHKNHVEVEWCAPCVFCLSHAVKWRFSHSNFKQHLTRVDHPEWLQPKLIPQIIWRSHSWSSGHHAMLQLRAFFVPQLSIARLVLGPGSTHCTLMFGRGGWAI